MPNDFKTHTSSELGFDPANPNTGPILNWECSQRDLTLAKAISRDIAEYVNARASDPTRVRLDPNTVMMDLIALHCNGRPQNFQAWFDADITDLVMEYSLIFQNFDRRLAKLPDFVKLRFDARS